MEQDIKRKQPGKETDLLRELEEAVKLASSMGIDAPVDFVRKAIHEAIERGTAFGPSTEPVAEYASVGVPEFSLGKFEDGLASFNAGIIRFMRVVDAAHKFTTALGYTDEEHDGSGLSPKHA